MRPRLLWSCNTHHHLEIQDFLVFLVLLAIAPNPDAGTTVMTWAQRLKRVLNIDITVSAEVRRAVTGIGGLRIRP